MPRRNETIEQMEKESVKLKIKLKKIKSKTMRQSNIKVGNERRWKRTTLDER